MMRCKFEHDGDCCNSGAVQYMCKCKQPCNTIIPITRADRMIEMLKSGDTKNLLDWWEQIFEDGVPGPDYFEWWLEQPVEEEKND